MPEPRDPRDDRDDSADKPADKSADELAWQAIVDNFGERAEIDDVTAEEPPATSSPFGGRFADASDFATYAAPPDPDTGADLDSEVEGYVPPEPPPLPRVAPDRGLAWAGVFGSPLVLLLALLLSISIPAWLGYVLVCSFVGGFIYLVVKMPREPRDPWDDGAQV